MNYTTNTSYTIDDNLLMRKCVQNFFTTLGIASLGEAEGFQNALKHIGQLVERGKYPEFISLDIHMPGINGDLMIPKLLSLSPSSNIIMVTSVANESVIVRCLKLGAMGYIIKPITAEKLKKSVEQIRQRNKEHAEKNMVEPPKSGD